MGTMRNSYLWLATALACFTSIAGTTIAQAGSVDNITGMEDSTMFDNAFPVLSWRYYNPGDYDQNGEVNGSDLTPLAQHLGAKVSGSSSIFAPNSIESVIDGD